MNLRNVYVAAAYKLFKYLDRLRPAGSLGWGKSIINDCRLLFNAYGFRPSIIYDVGANDGRTYKQFRVAFRSPFIVSVEPNQALWDKVVCAAESDSKFLLARCALGETPGTAFMEAYAQNADDLYDSNLSTLSSKPAFPRKAGYIKHSKFQVRVDTLDSLAESFDHHFIDILKIDVEGYEPEVLKGGKKMLSSCSVGIVVTEFSSILGVEAVSGSLASIAEILEPYGFVMASVCTDYVVHGLSAYANHNAIWVNPQACISASSGFT